MGAFCAPVRVVVPHLSCPTLPPCRAQAYEAGDWTKATSRLFECQKILKDVKRIAGKSPFFFTFYDMDMPAFAFKY